MSNTQSSKLPTWFWIVAMACNDLADWCRIILALDELKEQRLD